MFGRLGGGVVGSGLEDDLLAGERLALASQLASSPLAGDGAFVVVDPEVVIGPGGVAQQVPDDGKYRVADGDNRSILATPFNQPAVACAEECIGARESGDNLTQGSCQPRIAFTGRSRFAAVSPGTSSSTIAAS